MGRLRRKRKLFVKLDDESDDSDFGFNDIDGDVDKSLDWDPSEFAEVKDEPIVDDFEVKEEAPSSHSQKQRPIQQPPKPANKQPSLKKRRKARQMDLAFEDAIARMHAANRKTSRAGAAESKPTSKNSGRTIRLVRGAEGHLTWAEELLKSAYVITDAHRKNEVDKAGRRCLLNAKKLPQMVKDNAKVPTRSMKRKRVKEEPELAESNPYEESARKRRAIDLWEQREQKKREKKKKNMEYVAGIPVTKNENKKPNRPKHKILDAKPIMATGVKKSSPKHDNFGFDEDLPDMDAMLYAQGEESKMQNDTEQIISQDAGRLGDMKEKKWEPTDPNWSRVHVGGLDITVKWRELKKAFTHCGRVLLASIVHGRGFGFVTFATQEEARNAISDMNGRNFRGQPITVDWARGREGGGGHRRGRGGFRRRGRGRGFKRRGNERSPNSKSINFVRSKQAGGMIGNTKVPISYRPLHDGGNALGNSALTEPDPLGTYRPLPGLKDPELPKTSIKDSVFGFDEYYG